MHILFIADGRSPIALNWISYFVEQGHEVKLVSTYPCRPALPLSGYHILPVAFSSQAGDARPGKPRKPPPLVKRIASPSLRTHLRQWLGPLTLPAAARRLKQIIKHTRPDLVHAMRIPYEGMLAAQAKSGVPLLVSVWGNDFTLHAQSSPIMAYLTRQTLHRADALHTDCLRDLHLADRWEFAGSKPSIVLPGSGGVQPEIFYPPEEPGQEGELVINPRGYRAYIRNDTFFKSIPLVLAAHPTARFLCPAMSGEPAAHGWLRALKIEKAVQLLPKVSRPQMGALFRKATVAVSPSTHDGTPNTLLEAMACGCFPVAGDIESVREWISSGENGLLVDPGDPAALAEAIMRGLDEEDLRGQARTINLEMITRKAVFGHVMATAERFYRDITG